MVIKSRFFPDFKQTLPTVHGKVFVITGTTSGTGFIAARTVAEKGGEVVLLNRASGRVATMMSALKDAVPDGKFVPIECDLQNFDSVRKASKEIKGKYSKIYCLANNAGIMATPDKATVDGYDTQMQTNHLSHFLLASELMSLLQAHAKEKGEARIVNHTSVGRMHTPKDQLEEPYLEKNGGNLGGDSIGFMSGACFHRYFHSKLANIVFTSGLHQKLQETGSKVRAICAHPGVSDSHLADGLDAGPIGNFIWKYIGPFMTQSTEDGSAGLLKCMMDPKAESGALYGPTGMGGQMGKPVRVPLKPFETDKPHVDTLWRLSEKATGVKFF